MKRKVISRTNRHGRSSSMQQEGQDTIETLVWLRGIITNFLAQERSRYTAALQTGRPAPSVITSIDDLVKLVQLQLLLVEQLPGREARADKDITQKWLQEDEKGRELVAETWRRKMEFIERKKGTIGSGIEPQGTAGKGPEGNETPVGGTK